MHAFGPGPLLQEDLDTRRGARGYPLRCDDTFGRQCKQTGGNDGGTEMRDQPGGMKAGVVEATLAAAPTRIAVSMPAA